MRNISSKGRFRTKITQMQKAAQHKVERGAFTSLFDAELAQADLNRESNKEGVVVEDLLEDEFDNDTEEYDDVFDDFDVSDLSSSRDIDISDIHFTGDEDEDFDEMDEDFDLDDEDDDFDFDDDDDFDDMDEDFDVDAEDDLDDEDFEDDEDLDDDEDYDDCGCSGDPANCDCEDCVCEDEHGDDDLDDDEDELAETMFISYPKTFRMLKSASAAPGVTYANLPVEDQWTLLESAHLSDTTLRDYNSGMKRVNKSYSPQRDVKVSVRMCAMIDRDGDICGDDSSVVCRNQRTGSTYGLCSVHKAVTKFNRNLVVKEFRGGSKEDELQVKSRRSARSTFEAADEVPNTRKERKLEKAVKNRKNKAKRNNTNRTMIRKSSGDETDFSGQDGILSGDLNSPPKYLKPGSFSNVGAIFM